MINEICFNQRGWEISKLAPPDSFKKLIDELTISEESAGQSSEGTRALLSMLINTLKPKTLLEVGSHIGLGALSMDMALKNNGFGKLHSLEPTPHYFELLVENIKRADLEAQVNPLPLFSTDPNLSLILKEKCDLIFLDANHSYDQALADIEICFDLLSENGVIVFDDVGIDVSPKLCQQNKGGVRQAIIDFEKNKSGLNTIFLEWPLWLNPCGIAIGVKQRVL